MVEKAQSRCLRRLSGVGYWERKRNSEIREQLKVPTMESYVKWMKLKWIGHMARHGDVGGDVRGLIYGKAWGTRNERGSNPSKEARELIKEWKDKVSAGVDWSNWIIKKGENRNQVIEWERRMKNVEEMTIPQGDDIEDLCELMENKDKWGDRAKAILGFETEWEKEASRKRHLGEGNTSVWCAKKGSIMRGG